MDLNNLSFLVVDDDDGDRKLLRRALKSNGFSGVLVEATTVDEALAEKDKKYDVVFLDYYLPGTNGLNLLPELRAFWPRAAIILMTGQGNEDVAKSAILNGATDYISKGSFNETALSTLLATNVAAARQSFRVEQQRAELATFSEVLIHDFKAPIRAAAYLTEQIDEDLCAGEMEEVQQGLRLLKQSADQMNAMIRSLSDHIRLDRDVEVVAHPPEGLIDAAQTVLSLVVREADAKISVEIGDDVPEIMCNGPQIAQLVQNLIANAIKFSGDRRPEILVRATHESDGVCFEVRDNGVGIAPEHLNSVFEPFKRAPGAQGVAGTGLGLSTCRKIVMRHDGRIWCSSRLGQGTSVFFVLPVVSAVHAQQMAASRLAQTARG